MKLNFTFTFFMFTTFFMFNIHAQDMNKTVAGGEYAFNKEKTECLTNVQRDEIKTEIKKNIALLKTQNKLVYNKTKALDHPLFIWPVKKASNITYNDVWAISGYMDHDTAYPNNLKDYNCGTKTYDTDAGYNHLGVDIFTWPFSWNLMDTDGVEIVAAAPGQIIAKTVSNSDRSCSFNSNQWNAVYVQHADGSVALYGHMKQNSATQKNIGDSVVAGEYLGIVGSSGNSTGPHLHFEVYSEIEQNGVGQDILIDPFADACNNLNTDSWWQDQKPYVDSNINALLTHSSPAVFPDCPTTETLNVSNQFALNETAYFGLYLRDQVAGTSINLKIIRPNNTNLRDWNFDFVDSYDASWWRWSSSFDAAGEWKWQATYKGQTVTHTFNVGTLSVDEAIFKNTEVYPNPFNNSINIKSNTIIKKATVVNMLGQPIKVENITSGSIKEINMESASKGIYFLTLEDANSQKKTVKIVKE
ncbi:putative secreted protein (Por secretion system target) [Mariniflexile fucanivorans]|uniref:Putative secreted protein (Por secretion system target) n=1 Tax=Mariniflexile fucanivorans TaxID=264023 RepID=A0A4V2QES4_9FLAO|nr:peptidoglycan DD-metalloendopeptidase family protein [Mariniflexile fucanivorans]TCL69187.1 putative secreted protein (Por secretion system target) [Mariniflexile fucanivorans]